MTNKVIQPPTNVPPTGGGSNTPVYGGQQYQQRTRPQPGSGGPVQAPNNDQFSQLWITFFQSLVSPAAPIETVALTGSPFSFTCTYPGNLLIIGGTVSNVALTRARVTIPTLPVTSGFVPMAQNDVVLITYSVLPTVYFIPNMGGAGGT